MADPQRRFAVAAFFVVSMVLVPLSARADWQTSTGPDTDGTEVMVLTSRSETGHILFVSCRADGLAGIGLLEQDNQTDLTDTETESGNGQLTIANDEDARVLSPADIFRLDEEVIVASYSNVDADLFPAISLIEAAGAQVTVTFSSPNFDQEAVIGFDATGSTAGARALSAYCRAAGISE